jgi:hypothetical protein
MAAGITNASRMVRASPIEKPTGWRGFGDPKATWHSAPRAWSLRSGSSDQNLPVRPEPRPVLGMRLPPQRIPLENVLGIGGLEARVSP